MELLSHRITHSNICVIVMFSWKSYSYILLKINSSSSHTPIHFMNNFFLWTGQLFLNSWLLGVTRLCLPCFAILRAERKIQEDEINLELFLTHLDVSTTYKDLNDILVSNIIHRFSKYSKIFAYWYIFSHHGMKKMYTVF